MIEKVNGTINYPFFRIYSEALVEWLKQFNPIHRRLANAEPLRVLYGNPERIYTNQNILPDNEKISIPVIGAYLTGINPIKSWNIPLHLRFSAVYRMPNNRLHDLYSYDMSKLKTYELDYNVEFISRFKSDADFVLFSILRELSNGEIRYLLISGSGGVQWVPFKMEGGPRDTSDLSPGNAKDLTIKWEISFKVLNAYLPAVPTSELAWDSIVEQFNVEMNNSLNVKFDEVKVT